MPKDEAGTTKEGGQRGGERSPAACFTCSASYKLVALGVTAFATSFGAHVVAVNLPEYVRDVGAGIALIGLLIAVYDLAEIVAKPAFGYVADRKGLKKSILIAIAIFSLASISFLFVDPRWLIVVRLAQGLGAAGLSIISATLVAEYFPERRGRAFGIYNAIKGAGYVIGPVAGGAIVWAWDFRMIFVACFVIGVAAFILELPLPEPERKASLKEDDDLTLRGFLNAFRDRQMLPWYAVTVVNMFLVGILFGFLPVYAAELGYDSLRAGWIVGVAATAFLLVQPLAGHFADRGRPDIIILGGLLVAGAAVTALPFTSGPALYATALAGGAGAGVVWTNTDAIVSAIARDGQRATALGAAGSFKELGDMLGPVAIGLLAQFAGLQVGFAACGLAGIAAAGVVAAVALKRNRGMA